jgi:hypothetical protein
VKVQQAVQAQTRDALDPQAAVIHEQAKTIEELREYAGQLVEDIEVLQGVIEHQEATIAALRRALATQPQTEVGAALPGQPMVVRANTGDRGGRYAAPRRSSKWRATQQQTADVSVGGG